MNIKEKTEEIEKIFNDGIAFFNQYCQLDSAAPGAQLLLNNAGMQLYISFDRALKLALEKNYQTLRNRGEIQESAFSTSINNISSRKHTRHSLIETLQTSYVKHPHIVASDTKPCNFQLIDGSAQQVYNGFKHENGGNCDYSAYLAVLPEIRKFIQQECEGISLSLSSVEANQNSPVVQLMNFVHNFENGYYDYVLVADSLNELSEDHRAAISSIDWAMVVDFDPHSLETGLADTYIKKHKTSLKMFVPVSPEKTPFDVFTDQPYWFFAMGYAALQESVSTDRRDWKRRYGMKMPDIFKHYNISFPKPIIVIVLSSQQDKVNSTLDAIDSVYRNRAQYILLSAIDSSDFDDLNLRQIFLAAKDFAIGILAYCHVQKLASGGCWMPSKTGNCLQVDPSLYPHFELVHRDIAENVPQYPDQGKVDFLQGLKPLSWFGAKQEFAIRRGAAFKQLNNLIRNIEGNFGRTCIRHNPGVGGTTFLRDFSYQKRMDYPICIIRQYDPLNDRTVNQLRSLYQLLGSQLLVLVDSAVLTWDQFNNLYRDMKRLSLTFVAVYCTRSRKNAGSNEVILSQLDKGEFDAMCNRLKPLLDTDSMQRVLQLQQDNWNPFLISLYAFEQNYAGLNPFIESILRNMTPEQKKILLYLSIADRYANRPVSESFFCKPLLDDGYEGMESLGGSENVFAGVIIIGNDTIRNRVYRLRHPLFAEEIVSQLLFRKDGVDLSDDEKAQNLTGALLELIDQSHQNDTVPFDTIQEMLQNLFIIKDMDDASVDKDFKRFSPLIEYLRNLGYDSNTRIGLVFKKLVEKYPESSHFLAHLSRFYSNLEGNYEKGIECARNALEQMKNAGRRDPILHHIYGMSFVRRIQNIYCKKAVDAAEKNDMMLLEGVMEEIHSDANSALEAFSVSRLANDATPGYYAAISLCIQILDLAKKVSGIDDIDEFIRSNTNAWYLSCLDTAQSLMTECTESEFSDTTDYVRLDGRLKNWFGDLQLAVDLWERHLKHAQNEEKPRVRRFLARAIQQLIEGKDPSSISQDQIERILSLMEENLRTDQSDPSNIRIWFQAVRHYTKEDAEQLLDNALGKLSAWRASTDSLESHFYYYVLTCIKAIEGSTRAESSIRDFERVLKERSISRTDNRINVEWLGKGQGIARLKKLCLEDFRKNPDIQNNMYYLTGYIADIKNKGHGIIRCHEMNVFFNPRHVKQFPTMADIGKKVSFFMGFSYDGPRAYDQSVTIVDSIDKEPAIHEGKQPVTSDASTHPLNIPKIGSRVKCVVTGNNEYYVSVKLLDFANLYGSIHKNQLGDKYGNEHRPKKGEELYAEVLDCKNIPGRGDIWQLSLVAKNQPSSSSGWLPFAGFDFGNLDEK